MDRRLLRSMSWLTGLSRIKVEDGVKVTEDATQAINYLERGMAPNGSSIVPGCNDDQIQDIYSKEAETFRDLRGKVAGSLGTADMGQHIRRLHNNIMGKEFRVWKAIVTAKGEKIKFSTLCNCPGTP
jgi:hypothetical protein